MKLQLTSLRAWAPVLTWAGIMFGLSSIPGSSLPPVPISFADKIVHVGVYCVLGWLLCGALHRTARWTQGRVILVSILLAVGYGVSDEVHQLFVPFRSFDGFDVVADAVGATLGALARWTVAAGRRNQREGRTM